VTAAVAQPASPGSAPPRLSHVELVEAQAETFASPRRSYGLAARALFATLDACYGKPRTLSKFKVLELVARVPYRAWELVGAGVGRLRQRLLDSSAGHRYLVLDLTAVDRIDSTGLGAPSTRATPAADTHLADLLARYSLVRRFLPALVTTLRLHAALAGADVLAAAFTSVLVIALKPGRRPGPGGAGHGRHDWAVPRGLGGRPAASPETVDNQREAPPSSFWVGPRVVGQGVSGGRRPDRVRTDLLDGPDRA